MYRFLQEPATEGILGATATIIIAATTALGNLDDEGLMDNTQLRLYVIIAALVAGIFGICVFPPNPGPSYGAKIFRKLASSILCCLLFTGAVFRYTGWHKSFDMILFVDAVLGISGVAIITALQPVFVRAYTGWVSRKLPAPPDDLIHEDHLGH